LLQINEMTVGFSFAYGSYSFGEIPAFMQLLMFDTCASSWELPAAQQATWLAK
jgi:hypothetical protein